MSKCRNCGEEITGRIRQCPQCGILLKPKSFPRPADIVTYSPVGKIVTILAVVGCVLVCLYCGYQYFQVQDHSEDKGGMDIPGYEKSFSTDEETFIVKDFANLVDKGSAADYRYLIQAREIRDEYEYAISEEQLTKYYNKRDEAFESWCKAADAQFTIAESLPDALRYYCRADSIYPANPKLNTALQSIARKTGLEGAKVLYHGLQVNGNMATLYYKYYGSRRSSVRLKIVWNSGKMERIIPLNVTDDMQEFSFSFDGKEFTYAKIYDLDKKSIDIRSIDIRSKDSNLLYTFTNINK